MSDGEQRAAFEAAMESFWSPRWTFEDDGTGGYHDQRTELAWQGWLAAHQSNAAAQDVGGHLFKAAAAKVAAQNTADAIDARRWRRLLWAVEREFPILWVTEDPENDATQLTTAARIIDCVDGLDIQDAAMGTPTEQKS